MTAAKSTWKLGRAKLSEVAKKAGVSVTTASLVLAGKAGAYRISEDTYTRVKLAAAELDYAPNQLVRSLQRGSTQILSFFNGFRNRTASDLYMDTLSTAIERAGGRAGYDILVHCDFTRPDQATYELLNGGRADGLLFFAPQQNDPLLPLVRNSRLPTVLINGNAENGTLPLIKDDTASGMRQVADLLLTLGHRRIAAITDLPGGNHEAFERIELLRHYLQQEGVMIPDRWVLPANQTSQMNHLAALRFLLSEPEPPTALFCWHDHSAYNVLEHCETLGVSVPRQLSVLGYDGLRWPAATRHTATSIRVDMNALAEAAIQLLHRRILGDYEGSAHQILPVTLLPGTTTARPYGS